MAAPTYAEAAASGQSNAVKPVFIKEIDFFGVKKPPREQWIVNTELYKAIASVVPSEHLIGLQRVTGGLWRIYLDNSESRSNLLTSDFTFRGKSMPIYHTNPGFRYVDSTQMDPTLRIRIQNVPLSADDGQIKRALELKNCTDKKLYREKLRVDGRLTNCETGDRIQRYIVINSARGTPSGTPSRKSNAVPVESRSPVTPTDEKEARERHSKRPKDNR